MPKGISQTAYSKGLTRKRTKHCREICQAIYESGKKVTFSEVFRQIGHAKNTGVKWSDACVEIIVEWQAKQVLRYTFMSHSPAIQQAKVEAFTPIVKQWCEDKIISGSNISFDGISKELSYRYGGFPSNLRSRQWCEPLRDIITDAQKRQKIKSQQKQIQPSTVAVMQPVDRIGDIRWRRLRGDEPYGRCPITGDTAVYALERYGYRGWVKKACYSLKGRQYIQHKQQGEVA
jgi:hypothetical protein